MDIEIFKAEYRSLLRLAILNFQLSVEQIQVHLAPIRVEKTQLQPTIF